MLARKKLFFVFFVSVLLSSFLIASLTEFHLLVKLGRFFTVLQDILSEFEPGISHNVSDVRILIWTRRNPMLQVSLVPGHFDLIKTSGFNRSHPTKVLIHGFSDTGVTTWIMHFKKRYLNHADYNVISVDWMPLALSPWYTTATKNAKIVGRLVADFLDFLEKSEGVSMESVHLLGSSLGAQVAGFVGFFMGGRIGRITGLDPSGPLFHSVPSKDRLDAADAQFVDVIHTAGKWVGNDDIIGHVDFFPNLGRAPQPGCEGQESLDLSCSHFKAWQMYLETIGNEEDYFVALKCESGVAFASGLCCARREVMTTRMGEGVSNETRGSFYLYTNANSPLMKNVRASTHCQWIDQDVR